MADFTKKSAEIFPVSVDFEKVLDTGETLILGSSTVLVEDSDGNDVTSAMIVPGSESVSGSQYMAKVRAGTDDESYKISFQVTTSDSNVYEKDLNFKVKD